MRTPEEMLKLVEKYFNSGKSRNQFCAEIGVKPTTFSYWIKKKRMEGNPNSGFIKIDTAPIKAVSPVLEITYPNGVKLKVEDTNLSFLGHLIRIY
ncbi:MAG: IS66 family insertion sequence element accessory protein TnpB [Bacteroidetes bacterium]|nr:IS66 family insertion sequence element accessory protein TnpB [Bacteroidota bacterium]